MAKTLSESAAEILNASIGKNQEPAAKLSAEVEDLGGATNENPGGEGVGAKASAARQEAPKPVPGGKAAPQEGMNSVKTQGLAKPVVGDADLEDGAGAIQEQEVEAEEEVISETEQEVVAQDNNDVIREMIAKHKGSMLDDVNALFNGESLSEDFRVKATLIFEAAVTSRIEKILEGVLAENEEVLSEAYTSIKSELSEQVDEYLNYVVEQWVQDNQVAIDSGLRAELSEEFIAGLKSLFEQHYIEIPEDKIDIAEELAEKVVELEESLAASTTDLSEQVKALTEELNTIKKAKLIGLACEGLTQVQAGKLKSLAEGVEFTTEGDYKNKLAVIRENYFPTKQTVQSEVKVLQQESVQEPEVEQQVSGLMSHYVKAISKTAAKA